eukprot:TRINITY_DN24081_c0_g2_i1.p1 TRINITY_DN24081_c0_g2~~TRINITY_DN24081_c0_g2_i1.p1  ORF type:complete len:229 (-),score=88.60 TRINITY_DN24081_c0_g2_i1:122-727(-)
MQRMPEVGLSRLQQLTKLSLSCARTSWTLEDLGSLALPALLQEAKLSFLECEALQALPDFGLRQCQQLRSFKLDCEGCFALKAVASIDQLQELDTLKELTLDFNQTSLPEEEKDKLRELKRHFQQGTEDEEKNILFDDGEEEEEEYADEEGEEEKYAEEDEEEELENAEEEEEEEKQDAENKRSATCSDAGVQQGDLFDGA